jgi:hypothetical protein
VNVDAMATAGIGQATMDNPYGIKWEDGNGGAKIAGDIAVSPPELSNWFCRLCDHSSICGLNCHTTCAEAEKSFSTVNWTRPIHNENLRVLMKTHADHHGHRIVWNLVNHHGWLEAWQNGTNPDRQSNWVTDRFMYWTREVFNYADFLEEVPAWPPEHYFDLVRYVWKRCGFIFSKLYGINSRALRDAKDLAKISPNISNEVKETGNTTSSDTVWTDVKQHLVAMERAIVANWGNIKELCQEDVYMQIQDVFVGNHYAKSNVYSPDSELLYQEDTQVEYNVEV